MCVTPVDESRVCVGASRLFSLDHVYDVSADHVLIFRERLQPLLDGFLGGYNATVLAYGQTGTGKTHTMSSLAPLVLEHISSRTPKGLASYSFQLLEVYGESLHDLLGMHDGAPLKALQLLEGGQGTHVIGASRVKVNTIDEAYTLLEHGNKMRTTGATKMNAHSSRSHSIMTIFCHEKMSKLHFVDLAGSERNKKTHNVGVRFKESVGINTGLLALGNVIRALSSPSHPNAFVPYRASKLTRLLQDSLGGNSRTLFLACVAPDTANMDETIRTLQYSARAMQVLNDPLPNMDHLMAAQQRQMQRIQNALNLSSDEAVHQYADGDEFAAEQAAEIQRLTSLVSELERELRGARLELKKDEVIFANQLKDMRRVHKENEALRHRVVELETALVASENWRAAPPRTSYHSDPNDTTEDDDVKIQNVLAHATRGTDTFATPPRPFVSAGSSEHSHRPLSPPPVAVMHSPGTESCPDYVNLYSAQVSEAPSMYVPSTPVVGNYTEVRTAPRPSRMGTPQTGQHMVTAPEASPPPVGEATIVKVTPVRMVFGFDTPPRQAKDFDAFKELGSWSNKIAERLARGDEVQCGQEPFVSGSKSHAAPSTFGVAPASQPKHAASHRPPGNNAPSVLNTPPSPQLSSIAASTSQLQHVVSETQLQEILRDSLRMHHEQKVLRQELERAAQHTDVLQIENVSLKRELQQISEMLRY